MKKLFSLVLTLCLLLCPMALADSAITVQGVGVLRTTPDIAVVSLGAEETGEDVAAIQGAVNEKISAIIAALTGEGEIAAKDIKTSSYALYRRHYDDYGNPTKDYVATCSLSITVRDVNRAGDIIDMAFAAGANFIGGVSFSVEDADGALADQALQLAVADGMHRAQVIAGAAGITLPAVPSRISESGSVDYGPVTRSMASMDSAKGAEIMGGMTEITASVTVTYDIDD